MCWIKKKDLENNPDLANNVFYIMQNATPEQLAEMHKETKHEPLQPQLQLQPSQLQRPQLSQQVSQTSTPTVAVPPPIPVVKGPTPPPLPPPVPGGGPPPVPGGRPPPVPGGGPPPVPGGRPPPVPGGGPPPVPGGPPAPGGGPPVPSPPPVVPSGGGTSTSTSTPAAVSGSVFDQIKVGVSLKKVDSTVSKPPPSSSGGVLSLTETLLAAMKYHRKDIEGDDKQADDADWSD